MLTLIESIFINDGILKEKCFDFKCVLLFEICVFINASVLLDSGYMLIK